MRGSTSFAKHKQCSALNEYRFCHSAPIVRLHLRYGSAILIKAWQNTPNSPLEKQGANLALRLGLCFPGGLSDPRCLSDAHLW